MKSKDQKPKRTSKGISTRVAGYKETSGYPEPSKKEEFGSNQVKLACDRFFKINGYAAEPVPKFNYQD